MDSFCSNSFQEMKRELRGVRFANRKGKWANRAEPAGQYGLRHLAEIWTYLRSSVG
jgi:hypothetical protein